MPSDHQVAVRLLLEGAGRGWTTDDLHRLRRALADEHVGPDRTAAIAAVDRLLAGRATGDGHPDHPR